LEPDFRQDEIVVRRLGRSCSQAPHEGHRSAFLGFSKIAVPTTLSVALPGVAYLESKDLNGILTDAAELVAK
jgi:hypothetical protein